MVDAKLLVKHGFIKDDAKEEYDEVDGIFKRRRKYGDDIDPSHADDEIAEVSNGDFSSTGFPKTVKKYNLVYEVPDLNIEEPYFWVLDFLKGFYTNIIKVEDTFSASENSAFFGMSQQRLGVQQDKVGQYLATIGKMIKELFQMVRERRILAERLSYYNGALEELEKPMGERSTSDEITLKGIFVDLVQGGGKSPASVYGMARELEFVTLPDLFFDAPPFKSTKEMDKHIEKLGDTFNNNVLRVLRRHLRQFVEWKKRTHKEHSDRERFMLKYLWQHYEIIQMYVTWIKPYLKNVQRLSLKGQHQDSADMVSSFEGSMMDIEFIAHNPGTTHCLLVTFNYRTRPHLKFQQEGYNRGPVHVGKMDLQLRVMDWDDDTIKRYVKMKEEETIDLMGNISGSVHASMDALGDELKIYLEEAKALASGEKAKKEKEAKEQAAREKFSLKQFLFGDFLPEPRDKKKKKSSKKKPGDGTGKAMVASWNVYKNFKKAHRMVQW